MLYTIATKMCFIVLGIRPGHKVTTTLFSQIAEFFSKLVGILSIVFKRVPWLRKIRELEKSMSVLISFSWKSLRGISKKNIWTS